VQWKFANHAISLFKDGSKVHGVQGTDARVSAENVHAQVGLPRRLPAPGKRNCVRV